MAFFITTSTSFSQEIETETYLLPGVVLTVSDALALFESGGTTGSYLKIDGHAYVVNFIAVAMNASPLADPDTVVIGAAGTVDTNPIFDAIQMGGHEAHLTNHGAVTGGSAVAYFDALFARIDNFGLLEGTGRAAIRLTDSNSVQIRNEGIVTGPGCVVFDNSYAQIVNAGLMLGSDSGVAAIDASLASGSTVVRNSGRIEAVATAYLGSVTGTTFVNTGTVVGDVRFGASGDEFRGARGLLDGWLFADLGNDILRSGTGDDQVFGGGGHDLIHGNDGDDALSGGAGNDTIAGGHDDDALTGNNGRDVFAFRRQGGDDRIDDFVNGDDRLDLSTFHPANFAAVSALARDVAGGMFLDLTGFGGGTVLLAGFVEASFDAADVIL